MVVLMVVGAAHQGVSCVCPDSDRTLIETGPRRIVPDPSSIPPFADASIEIDRTGLVIEYTGDDAHRYRVTYDVVSRFRTHPPGRGLAKCERTWVGDFAGHADVLVGVTKVTGNVWIEGYPNRTLESLRCLREIEGDLAIASNDGLTSLRGLELEWITGDLRISGNAALADVTALEGAHLVGTLEITDNPSLRECDAEALADALRVPAERREIQDNGFGSCP
jgi:hypothetical protein